MNPGRRAAFVTPWKRDAQPTEAAILGTLSAEGLAGYRWSNGPGDRYAAHMHSYDKVIFVVQGSVDFGLPDTGESFSLSVGDRLDLPAGTRHDAVVGPRGVVCLEAHRSDR